MRCNQCDDAPCMAICPTTALFRADNGVVDFDDRRCIGCKSCMNACPYDAIYINPETSTAHKCNMLIGEHSTKFASHNWRAAGAGNLGGWQVARCLFFLNVLTGSVVNKGGTLGNGLNKIVPAHPLGGPAPKEWNELCWPREYPLAYHEMSILLPHFLNEGRGTLDVYFSRVYNPIWPGACRDVETRFQRRGRCRRWHRRMAAGRATDRTPTAGEPRRRRAPTCRRGSPPWLSGR